MTFYLCVLAVVFFVLFSNYQKRKKEAKRDETVEGRLVSENVLSKSDVGGGISMSIVSQTVDTRPIKEAKAKEIINNFKKPYTIEQEIIADNPMGFIYFVKSYHSRINRIKYNIENNKPRNFKEEISYVPADDSDEKFTERKFHDWALKFKLADRGYQIPTEEILQSLQLKKGLNQISDKQFTRIKPAVEYLIQLPDIDKRLDDFTPRENYYKLKVVELDFQYLYDQAKKIFGEDI